MLRAAKRTKKILLYTLTILSIISCNISAQTFSQGASYTVCFTPDQNCTNNIVNVIENTKQTILVQAYSFTSVPIAEALVNAKKRGVDVKVILDKSQFKAKKYSASRFLDNQGIPVWIDAKPAIAHNKIMILDGMTVLTGSFNFTKAAEEKNAENLIIIQDKQLAMKYTENWLKRQKASTLLSNYHP